MFGLGTFEISMIIIPIVCAILGYRLAKARNREAGIWAVVCFLLPNISYCFAVSRAVAKKELKQIKPVLTAIAK